MKLGPKWTAQNETVSNLEKNSTVTDFLVYSKLDGHESKLAVKMTTVFGIDTVIWVVLDGLFD